MQKSLPLQTCLPVLLLQLACSVLDYLCVCVGGGGGGGTISLNIGPISLGIWGLVGGPHISNDMGLPTGPHFTREMGPEGGGAHFTTT